MAESKLTIFANRTSIQDRSFIARQLAVMLDSGLPLTQAIRSLSEQAHSQSIKYTLLHVLHDLENGYKFSEAIKKFPHIFNDVFVAVVAAGEASGKLDQVLEMLADELERDYGFRSKVLGAMLYPLFIIAAMIVVGIIMVTRIVPALQEIFAESNVPLPWTTKTVVAITLSLLHYWYVYVIVISGLIYLIGHYSQTPDGKRNFSQTLLKTPVVGNLFLNLEMARMTRILGILLTAGVPIIQSINSVAMIMDSVVHRDALLVTAKNVERGAPISQSLTKFTNFPTTVTEMIAVGEKTGKLDQVLMRLASFYETQTDQQLKNATSLIEPVVFVIVGLGVAFLVFSIIVPIYSLANVIH